MLLAVDIGNTQCSFGVYESGGLKFHWRLDSIAARSADALAAFLIPLFSHASVSFDDLSHIALCSVVPGMDRILEDFARAYLPRCDLFRVDATLRLACDLKVDSPHEVGADRLANAQFAALKLELPTVVVDFGTATTFDVVIKGTHRPSYEGGAILPGVRIALDALSQRTSKLPGVQLIFPETVISKNTVECVQSGLLYGYLDMVDGILQRIETELGSEATVVLTGGLGRIFENRLRHPAHYMGDLTLDGIELIWRHCRVF